MFCKKTELVSESDVEQKLAYPMLTSPSPRGLEYGAEEIRTKHSLRRFEIEKGDAKKLYFPDYIVVLAGLPVMVVEVKAPGEDVEDALREARLYAAELNALYQHGLNPCQRLIATDGLRLLSSPADTATADIDIPLDGITELDARYANFTEKVDRKHLAAGVDRLLKLHAREEYVRAVSLIGGASVQDEEIPNNTFGADIASHYRHLFNPTSRDDRRFIAKHAYVASRRREQYVEPIDRIIRAAVPPSVSRSRAIDDTASPTPVVKALKRASELKLHHEVMLLIGSVGSGKTTFIDYIQEKALSPEVRGNTEWVHINMNDAPVDQARVYDWVLDEIIQEFKEIHSDVPFNTHVAWDSIFSAEINKFTNTVLSYLPAESPSRSERLADEMQRLMASRDAVVNAMIRTFCVEKEKAFILVLDNSDKLKLDEQLLMFQVAQWAKKTFRCTVFLPIRDITYDLYRSRPPLDTALKDLVFHIEPPLFSKVLARRIALALDAMKKEDGRQTLQYTLQQGIHVEYPSSDRAMYLVSIVKSLFEYDRIVRRLITALAGRDVRKAMELFLEFCTSGHITENDIFRIKQAAGQYTLDYAVVVRVLLRMNRRFYDGNKSYVHNLLQCDPRDSYPDNFVRMAILRWLQQKFTLMGPTNVTGYHPYRELLASLVAHGHEASRLRKEVTYLVRHGCIATERQDIDRLDDQDLICISSSGWVHIELLQNADYLAACAEDLAFGDRACAQRIANRIGSKGTYGHYSAETVRANARELINYVKSEAETWYRVADKFLATSDGVHLHSLEPLDKALRDTVASEREESYQSFGVRLSTGEERVGRVVNIKDYGIFVRLVNEVNGLAHLSKLPRDVAKRPVIPSLGQRVRVRIIAIVQSKKQIELDVIGYLDD